jgi:hypothetical protein
MGKKATFDFILFKAREAFGTIVAPLSFLIKIVGLGKCQMMVNLYDIMTCVAGKPPVTAG